MRAHPQEAAARPLVGSMSWPPRGMHKGPNLNLVCHKPEEVGREMLGK